MTTYSEITNSEIDPDSPLTTGLVTRLRDNPLAVMEGNSSIKIESGAYKPGSVINAAIASNAITEDKIPDGEIDSSEVATGAIKQSHLSISTTTVNVGDNLTITPAGGLYHLGWEGLELGGTGQAKVAYGQGIVGSYTSSYVTAVTFFDVSGIVQMRGSYISASPPYKIGQTTLPYFAYLLIDSQEKIVSYTLGFDPPWAYNGPHKCATRYVRQSKGRGITPVINQVLIPKRIQELKKTDLKTYYEERRKLKNDWVDLTPELKNRNMPYCPHPFLSKNPGDRVVMVAPDDSIMQFLLDLHDDDEVNMGDLFGRYLTLGDQVSIAGSPPGVSMCKLFLN